MENNISQRVRTRLSAGISVPFDRILSESFALWKKVTAPIAIVLLIIAIPVIVMYVIAMPFMLGLSSFEEVMDVAKNDPHYMKELQQSMAYLIKSSVLGVLLSIVIAPVQAGFLRLCRDTEKTGDVRFNVLFSYFSNPYTLRLMISSVLITLVMSAAGFGLGQLGLAGKLLNVLVLICLSVLLIYVQPFIIFGNAGVGQAFSLSFAVAGKKFFPVLGTLLFYGLLAILGILLCGVGFFFTVAFLPICNYLLYKYSVGFPEDETGEQFTGEPFHHQPM